MTAHANAQFAPRLRSSGESRQNESRIGFFRFARGSESAINPKLGHEGRQFMFSDLTRSVSTPYSNTPVSRPDRDSENAFRLVEIVGLAICEVNPAVKESTNVTSI